MADAFFVGFRCTAKDITYAVLKGKKSSPTVLKTATCKCPNGYSVPMRLRWVKQEIDQIFSEYSPTYVVIKADEGRARNQSFLDRISNEAIIFLCLSDIGLNSGGRYKRQITLAKDLAGKGRTRYLKNLDTSPIDDFDRFDQKTQDAVLCAWSELK